MPPGLNPPGCRRGQGRTGQDTCPAFSGRLQASIHMHSTWSIWNGLVFSWTREIRSRVLVPWGGLFLFFLGSHHPSSCRLRACTLNGADYCRPRDMAAQDRPRCDTHAGSTYFTYLLTYSIHTLAEGDGGVRGGGGERRHVDRADFDGASRGEVRIEWLTLCPPADPMDRKPMDAV